MHSGAHSTNWSAKVSHGLISPCTKLLPRLIALPILLIRFLSGPFRSWNVPCIEFSRKFIAVRRLEQLKVSSCFLLAIRGNFAIYSSSNSGLGLLGILWLLIIVLYIVSMLLETLCGAFLCFWLCNDGLLSIFWLFYSSQ